MIIAVDIDGVLCEDLHENFKDAKPYKNAISYINKLHDAGHTILIYTARGQKEDNVNALTSTVKQLDSWGVKYDIIRVKQFFDIMVEDKAIQSVDSLKKMFEKFGDGR